MTRALLLLLFAVDGGPEVISVTHYETHFDPCVTCTDDLVSSITCVRQRPCWADQLRGSDAGTRDGGR